MKRPERWEYSHHEPKQRLRPSGKLSSLHLPSRNIAHHIAVMPRGGGGLGASKADTGWLSAQVQGAYGYDCRFGSQPQDTDITVQDQKGRSIILILTIKEQRQGKGCRRCRPSLREACETVQLQQEQQEARDIQGLQHDRRVLGL